MAPIQMEGGKETMIMKIGMQNMIQKMVNKEEEEELKGVKEEVEGEDKMVISRNTAIETTINFDVHNNVKKNSLIKFTNFNYFNF